MTPQISPETLLQQLASSRGDLIPTPQELVAQLAAENPALALIATLLAQRDVEAEEPAGAEEESGNAETELLRAAQFDRLREINGVVAAALGACDRCWGTDDDCRTCLGDGAPGAFLPDPELFDELVSPAIRRLRRRGPTAPTKANPTERRQR